MDIKIAYKKGAKKLKKLGDWIDLYCYEDTFCVYGKQTLVPLGVMMKLPEDYEAILAPRSSTFGKYGVLQANGIGVIDSNYCGPDDEWKMPVVCINAAEPEMIKTQAGNLVPSGRVGTWIRAGERIAQFRIQPVMGDVELIEVDQMEGKNRGGFGSTGRE